MTSPAPMCTLPKKCGLVWSMNGLIWANRMFAQSNPSLKQTECTAEK